MANTPKEIIFEEEARLKLLKGIEILTDIVACTLGPKGRNICLGQSWGSPRITNDGRTIVNDIELKDTFENMGVSIAKEVVQKIKEKCGDGTTTGILLLRAFIQHGMRYVSSGASPIGLKRGMEKALEATCQALEKLSIAIKDDKDILNVAKVSASGNDEVGQIIAEAIKKVGRKGVITIEEAKGTETTIEVVEGMQFDRGYLSSYFCTNAEKMVVEMNRPSILLVDKKINSVHEILPILQQMASTGKELLIVAEDIEGDALSTLVVNKLRNILRIAAVKAPGFGDRRKAMMQDLAILTGATLITDDAGISLKDASSDLLGSCEKIIITKDHTTIINGNGDKKQIEARLKQIEAEIKACTSSYDKEKLEERRAKLSGGVAVIKVGAATEPELKHKKQAFEDSLNSTKAAIEEGIVPGGGVALLRASKAAGELKLEGDELLGAKLFINACQAPLRQIAINAGFDGSVIFLEVTKAKQNFGFNAMTEIVEDLVLAGVIDPTKVVKNALIFATSAAGIVLISEVLIANAKEEEETD